MVVWKKEYETGISVIDFDHKTLFSITNILSASIENNEGQKAIGRTINDLIDYIEKHFRREEGLFLKSGFKDAEAHCKKHREIEKTVRDIARKYEADPTSINSKEFLIFLENWLARHILKSDVDYIPSVREHAALKQKA